MWDDISVWMSLAVVVYFLLQVRKFDVPDEFFM
jgi:hypothetical protein